MAIGKLFVAEKLKERLSATFDNRRKIEELNPSHLSQFLMTCTHFDFKPEAAILASKQRFIANPYGFDVPSATTMVQALCLLNEIDDDVMEAVRQSRLAFVGPAELSMTERRHVCRLLIAMKILQSKACPEDPPVPMTRSLPF